MAKGGRVRIAGSGAPAKRTSSAKTGQRVDVPGAPKQAKVSKKTYVGGKGVRVPGSKGGK